MARINILKSESPKIAYHFRLNSISILGSIKDIISGLHGSVLNGKFVQRLGQLGVLNQVIFLASQKDLLTHPEEEMHRHLRERYLQEGMNLKKELAEEKNSHLIPGPDIEKKTDESPDNNGKNVSYKNGCELLAVIENKISQHDKLKYFYNNHRIICKINGEVATGLMLEYYINHVLVGFGKYKQTDPEIIELKKNATAVYYSGSNDATILIDPRINEIEFEQIYKIIVELIKDTMNEYDKAITNNCTSWLNPMFHMENLSSILIYADVSFHMNLSSHEINHRGDAVTSCRLFRLSGKYTFNSDCISSIDIHTGILELSMPHRNDTASRVYFDLPDEKKMLLITKILISGAS